MTVALRREMFGQLPDGQCVERVTLRTTDGFEVRILTYGATLQALLVPDRHGNTDDVVLGFDDLAGYTVPRRYFGMTVGRYANRIAQANFELDGTLYTLAANDGVNALHGGVEGFSRKLWTVVDAEDGAAPSVTLACRSPHNEEGYPGTLDVRVTYRISGPGELTIDAVANTDQPTVISLTNHSFFNLDGTATGRDVLGHRLSIAADEFLAIDESTIPLAGPPRNVADTPFDFRDAQAIGARIREANEQLRRGRGYDHNFCLRPATGIRLAAHIESPQSGRRLELHTNQPGLQFYAGNYLDGTVAGKHGRLYRQSDALCLEPQSWPDAPNRPDFPSARLNPGETYRNHKLYRFSTS